MKFPTVTRPFLTAAVLALAGTAGHSAAAEPGKGLAYVSNQKGEITVIDLATFAPAGEIDAGSGSPRGIGVTADGKLLISANRDGGDIAIIERTTGKLVKRVPIGENPEFVRIRGDYAFVSFEPASEGGPPPAPGSEEAKKLQQKREEENEEPARIAVVDLKKGEKLREIVGGMETEGIEFSADGKNIIITNEADENLSVHDIETGKLVKKIDTRKHGNRPRGIKMHPSGKYYAATLEYGNKLVVLDDKFNITKVVPTGAVPYGLMFDRSGQRLFVALAKGKALQVFDTASWKVVKEIPVGDRCWHFTYTPDESHILVACGRSNDIHVIDAKTLTPVKRIEDKKLPWGIVTWPKSIGSLDMP